MRGRFWLIITTLLFVPICLLVWVLIIDILTYRNIQRWLMKKWRKRSEEA